MNKKEWDECEIAILVGAAFYTSKAAEALGGEEARKDTLKKCAEICRKYIKYKNLYL